ncbi:collagen alpha-1(XV) chain-like [Penaeus indicus]|uniref:collagen alpha-1(XV) chain-like n=1 Tax=Penaeus indicus TaxID=29960 RepID=UPI00300DBC16
MTRVLSTSLATVLAAVTLLAHSSHAKGSSANTGRGILLESGLDGKGRGILLDSGLDGLAGKESIEELDLLQGIAVPFGDPTTQYFVTGFDGFPAFGFKAGASIKHPYRLFLPERLYRQFSILVAVKPDTAEPMFLFAVVNPLENLIQLGVSITPGNAGSTNISLYYTDGERHMTSQTIASFLVPQFTGIWTRFAFKVTEDEIHLWFNCQLSNMLLVKRIPLQLVFDSASTLYIGQAGGIFKGEFELPLLIWSKTAWTPLLCRRSGHANADADSVVWVQL